MWAPLGDVFVEKVAELESDVDGRDLFDLAWRDF